MKKLEEENKFLQQQLAVGKRDTELEIQNLKTRLEDHSKIESMLKNENAELKQELQNKSESQYLQARSDKENYKQRMNEAERKAKEADSKRS